MSAASNYLENNIINATLRGAAFPTSAAVYVSLHTADPNDTGANEVNTSPPPAEGRPATGTVPARPLCRCARRRED